MSLGKKRAKKHRKFGISWLLYMFRGNLPYRLLGQNFYPLHRFRLSKSRHRFPRNILTLISHKTTTGSPVLLSDIVTDVATNRIYTGFSPHLHCRTQKRPCQFGRNSEPTKSFSYTYLLRVLPQISFSSQAKGFAPNEDKSFAPGITLTLISHIITTGSPVLLSYIVTDVATNRIYTGFSPHLHCRTQKRPCQFGRNSEPTKSFSYTYLLRVLPQISFSSQAKGFAKNEDKSFALGIVLYSGNPLYPQKAKSFILTYFLFQGILGLPSRSWLTLSFFSLISRYSSIFKAFSMVLSKRKKTS